MASTAALTGISLGSAYMGAKASDRAAGKSAGASRYGADLVNKQYLQNRQDLSPYRDVAVGQEVRQGEIDSQAYMDANPDVAASGLGAIEHYNQYGKAEGRQWTGELDSSGKPLDPTEVTGYTGGALNELADYGRSQVNPNDYIPNSAPPEFQGRDISNLPNINSNIPQFDVGGNVSQFNYGGDVPQYNVDPSQNPNSQIPEFDSQQFDLYKDPSYEFRRDEALRGIDRTAGATGKITSGNRIDEIMQRSGQLASQEYGAARGRFVQDYEIGRQNESAQYGRDTQRNQTGFDRANLGYDVNRANEAQRFGRAVDTYGLDRSVEDTTYGRDLTGYDANRQNEGQQYGRNVDNYNRAYGLDTDNYGRYLNQFNADTSREQQRYGRGVDDYGRAYGQESDYLNRLSSLSNIGQTATDQTGVFGTNAANSQAASIQNAGNADAAGILGRTNAWTGAAGDALSLYGQFGGFGGGNQNYGGNQNFSNYVPQGIPQAQNRQNSMYGL